MALSGQAVTWLRRHRVLPPGVTMQAGTAPWPGGPAGGLRRCVAVQANDRNRACVGVAAVVSCQPGKDAGAWLGCWMGEPWQ